MDLPSKLQLKPGQKLECMHMPQPVASTLTDYAPKDHDLDGAGLLVFVADRAALEDHRAQIVEAASADRLTWVSHPKSGQLATDLNRDLVARLLTESGIQPVRQIAIDGVWSALRFRPGS